MQPIFQQQRLAGFLPVMVTATGQMLERWRLVAAKGEVLDVASEMMRLTYTIVGRALFGADVESDVEEVERASAVVLGHTYRRLERIFDWPLWLPTPGNLRFRRALRALDAIVYRIIRRRGQDTQAPSDLLTLLLRQRDEETGAGMSDEQVRNESITLLMAGHETTANALAWTWYLLSKYPEVARRVRDEASAVLGDRSPTFDDLPRLRYTTAVFQEAMRLYPPIWVVERRALADDVIGGYHIPAGSTVAFSPYVTHRHPDFWPNPEGFDPDRFGPEQSARRAPYSYIPFGGGQRLCIGNHFALMEAQVIVALVALTYRLDLLPGFPVEPLPGITLRTRRGLPMRLFPAACGVESRDSIG
jgi:cytochrome P450